MEPEIGAKPDEDEKSFSDGQFPVFQAISRVGSPPTATELTQAETAKPEKKASIFGRKKSQKVSMAEHVGECVWFGNSDDTVTRGFQNSIWREK